MSAMKATVSVVIVIVMSVHRLRSLVQQVHIHSVRQSQLLLRLIATTLSLHCICSRMMISHTTVSWCISSQCKQTNVSDFCQNAVEIQGVKFRISYSLEPLIDVVEDQTQIWNYTGFCLTKATYCCVDSSRYRDYSSMWHPWTSYCVLVYLGHSVYQCVAL